MPSPTHQTSLHSRRHLNGHIIRRRTHQAHSCKRSGVIFSTASSSVHKRYPQHGSTAFFQIFISEACVSSTTDSEEEGYENRVVLECTHGQFKRISACPVCLGHIKRPSLWHILDGIVYGIGILLLAALITPCVPNPSHNHPHLALLRGGVDLSSNHLLPFGAVG